MKNEEERMADDQPTQPSAPEPAPLTMMDFVNSLWRGERADNYFKFLKERPEKDVDLFFQGLLRTLGDAIDDHDIDGLTHFVQQQQVQFYLPTSMRSCSPLADPCAM